MSLVRLLIGIIIGAGTVFASGCTEEGFSCGQTVPGNPSTVRRCDRQNEICICRTGKCAVLDTRAVAANRCPSGYRYTAPPFGPSTNVESCVPAEDISSAVSQISSATSCQIPDASSDSGSP